MTALAHCEEPDHPSPRRLPIFWRAHLDLVAMLNHREQKQTYEEYLDRRNRIIDDLVEYLRAAAPSVMLPPQGTSRRRHRHRPVSNLPLAAISRQFQLKWGTSPAWLETWTELITQMRRPPLRADLVVFLAFEDADQEEEDRHSRKDDRV